MWVEFLVVFLPCSERFFSGYSGFPLSLKTNISTFQFDLDYCQTLYDDSLVPVIAQALSVFDIKFNLIIYCQPLISKFSKTFPNAHFCNSEETTQGKDTG